MSHSRGFHSNLVKRAELFYLPMKLVNIPGNMKLDISMTGTTGSAAITPVTITPTGMEVSQKQEMTHGHSTHKDSWSEHTGQHAKHSSYQTAGVQYQQTDLRTTEEPLSTDKMATTKTLKTSTKISTSHNRKESCKDQHGQEKHGSE